jgi:hypothetical protein
MVALYEITPVTTAHQRAQVQVQLRIAFEAGEPEVEIPGPDELAVSPLQLIALAGVARAVVGEIDRAIDRPSTLARTRRQPSGEINAGPVVRLGDIRPALT